MHLSFLTVLLAVFSFYANSSDEDSFFRSLDHDADGDVDKEELASAIRDAGGVDVNLGVSNALNGDEDDSLNHSDLVSHWISLANLLNPTRVGEWLTHAVDLPEEIASKFVLANVTGLDLPSLIGPNSERILLKLNVTLSRNQRIKLLGAIKLRMLNAGKVPSPPELKHVPSAKCGPNLLLTWQNAITSVPEVHKYRLLRRIARDDDLYENAWELVYEGLARSFSDRIKLVTPVLLDYKIEAWNVMGCSESMELHDVEPHLCEQYYPPSSSGFWMQWVFLLINLLGEFKSALVSFNAVVVLLVYYFSSYQQQQQQRGVAVPSSLGLQTKVSAPVISSSPPLLSATPSFSASPFLGAPSLSLRSIHSNGNNNNSSTSTTNGLAYKHTAVNINRCAECHKSVTRNTRHHCGRCLQVFCVVHTRLQPHLVVGNNVLTACGVNSKCRCFSCFQAEHNENAAAESSGRRLEDESTASSKSWKVVRNHVLLRKTLRIWKRNNQAETTSSMEEVQ